MKRPLFFCHIPKTAGTSLRFTLEQNFAREEIAPGLTEADNYPSYDAMAEMIRDNSDRVQLLRGHYPYCSRALLPSAATIVVFREPVARTVSNIRHVLRHGGRPREDVLADLDRGVLPVENNLMTRYMGWSAAEMAAGPHAFLTATIREPRLLLSRAMAAIPSVDFLGLSESIGTLQGSLSDYGLKISIPTHNVSPPSDWRPTPLQLDVIRESNKLDAQLYNEACRDFTRRYSEPVYENGQVAV